MRPVGAKPKPLELRRLEGNRSKTFIPEKEPPPAAIVTCPAFLNAIARREWRRVAPQLQILGLLTALDRGPLAAYCQAYGTWVEASRKAIKKGLIYADSKDNIRKNPYLNIVDQALNQIYRWCNEFGMTPSSRARMIVAAKGESNDPMEQLLSNRNN